MKAEKKYVEKLIGSDALPVAWIMVVEYISPEGEATLIVRTHTADVSAGTALGMLEMAKQDVMGIKSVGPFDPAWQDE